mgnify:CR=1 FL=1
MRNEFSRSQILLGASSMEKLKNSRVAVFGLGGVGSFAAEALVRTGVGHLLFIDNDVVSLTNINRQSIAYHSTVGRYKTEVMRERIQDICPETEVKTFETFVLADNTDGLFAERPDYIVDAIDTVTAKLAVIERADKEHIPVISCMGTGNKLHPELFEIEDLSRTSVCPLCKVMRKELKKRGIEHVKVLYSKEKPVDVSGRDTGEDKGQRRSLPGSISFTPPVAGLLIAGEVVRDIAGL